MTEIELHAGGNELAQQMDYARAVSSGDLLPQAYRGKPANVLLAIGLGQSMGLSPAESLYRIDVIQGKPTASAELIAANVRKAGHKLRVRVDDQAVSATATIIRADDEGYEHTVTRDQAWAKQMGLLNKDNYKKQPTTMLQWRAITAVARQACPEALYGVAYTPDEMFDLRDERPTPAATTGRDRLMQAAAEAVPEPEPTPAQSVAMMTKAQQGKVFALLGELGVESDEQRRAGASQVLGRDVTSFTTITKAEAARLIDSLEQAVGTQQPSEDDEVVQGELVDEETGEVQG
ncbi:recombinase RecT [Aeromicrobium piscarium]|uniref:Recombinase RecT n=1 Tax=Aeromicrobium piscarium TaxID=2590901 RepID=A0A554SP13_9ACTN|nr:recombinase RecT [Aeromicrobium piscarium]TSD68103.1 recombinase RecT [Aeromicrobium piscarium]